jgi:hypothetical protein
LISFELKHTLQVLLFSSFPFFSICQDYDSKLTLLNLSINSSYYIGYQTEFDFEPDAVKLGFWKYSKRFGQLINKGTYYVIKIPALTEGRNTDLHLFLTLSEKKNTQMHLALDTAHLPDKSLKLYLILDFKKEFYWGQYQKVIDTKTAEANKLSKRYRQISKNSPNTKQANTTLEHLLAINHEIEKLKKLQLIL